MDRKRAEKILAEYNARRYSEELPPALLRDLAHARILEPGEPVEGQNLSDEPLTPAELLVVRFASYGLNNIETADVTGLAYGTVQSQIKRAMRKLRAKNRTHLVALALREGLID